MELEEVEIFERLKRQFNEGLIVKRTIVKARDIYNRFNADQVNYCMCTSIKRQIYAKQFITWYEGIN